MLRIFYPIKGLVLGLRGAQVLPGTNESLGMSPVTEHLRYFPRQTSVSIPRRTRDSPDVMSYRDQRTTVRIGRSMLGVVLGFYGGSTIAVRCNNAIGATTMGQPTHTAYLHIMSKRIC